MRCGKQTTHALYKGLWVREMNCSDHPSAIWRVYRRSYSLPGVGLMNFCNLLKAFLRCFTARACSSALQWGTNLRASTAKSFLTTKFFRPQRQTIQKAGRTSEQPLDTKPCSSRMTTLMSASQTARSPLHGCQRRRTRRAPGRRRRVRLRLSRASQQSLLCIDFLWKPHSSRCDVAAGCCKQHAAAGSPGKPVALRRRPRTRSRRQFWSGGQFGTLQLVHQQPAQHYTGAVACVPRTGHVTCCRRVYVTHGGHALM